MSTQNFYKKRFPIFATHPDLIYLDSAATAQKPQEMIDTLSSFYSEECATVHRAVYRFSLQASEKYHATRQAARKFINAEHVDEIVFTRGTTSALNLVARSFGKAVLQPGDEIVITQMEHHSNIVPWQMIAEERKATLRILPATAIGTLEWTGVFSPKTKIVAVAHASNVTGTIHPIREMAKAAHLVGAVIVVDGAQGAAHLPVDVQELDADFYAFSGHKCYGPTGVGILYGKRALLEKMAPLEGGGDMIEKVDLFHSTYQKPPLRFEAGTPIIAPVIALKASLDFMEEVGRKELFSHGKHLLDLATHGVSKIPGVRILGTAENKVPVLTFVMEGKHSLDVAGFFDIKQIALRSGHLCAQPILRHFGVETALRASFGIYNTEEDVEAFLTVLRSLPF